MPATVEELQSQLLELGEKAYELRSMKPEDRGDTWITDVRETSSMITLLDTEVKTHEARMALEHAPGPRSANSGEQFETRSAGEQFTASDEFGEWIARGAHRDSPALEIERRNLLNSFTGSTSASDGGVLLPRGDPGMPRSLSRRRLFVRDLIAPGNTTLSSVPYVRELSPRLWELGASAVPEGSAKPEVFIQFEAADAPVRTVAAWVPVTNQVMEDVPTLRSYIDGRLGYMVLLREEDELLNGPGTGARILGILNFPNIQTQGAGTDKPITVGTAISKIELVDGEADGVVINPVDYWTMATTRSSTRFDGEAFGAAYNSGLPYSTPPTELWGLPVVRSRTIAQGTALVGSFRMGAQVFDRSTVSIRVTDSHQDYFIYNKQVIRAEARLALAVHRPDFFVKVTLP